MKLIWVFNKCLKIKINKLLCKISKWIIPVKKKTKIFKKFNFLVLITSFLQVKIN